MYPLRCRPHVVGRRCDTPQEGYYVASLDYLTYEAELANGSEVCSFFFDQFFFLTFR